MDLLLVDPSESTRAALPDAPSLSFSELANLHFAKRLPPVGAVCIEGNPSEERLRWLREVFPDTPRLGRVQGPGYSKLHHRLEPEPDWPQIAERTALLKDLLADPRLKRFRLEKLPTVTPLYRELVAKDPEPEQVLEALGAHPRIASKLSSLGHRASDRISGPRDCLLYLGVPTTLRLICLAEQEAVRKVVEGQSEAEVVPTPTRPVRVNNPAKVSMAVAALVSQGKVQVIRDKPRASWNATLRRVDGRLELQLGEEAEGPFEALRMVGMIEGDIHVAPLRVQAEVAGFIYCPEPKVLVRYQRRGHDRRRVALSGSIRTKEAESPVEVADISMGGMGVYLIESLMVAPEDEFRVRLRLSERHEVDLGVVCTTRAEVEGRTRLGLRFTGLTSTQRKLLERLTS